MGVVAAVLLFRPRWSAVVAAVGCRGVDAAARVGVELLLDGFAARRFRPVTPRSWWAALWSAWPLPEWLACSLSAFLLCS